MAQTTGPTDNNSTRLYIALGTPKQSCSTLPIVSGEPLLPIIPDTLGLTQLVGGLGCLGGQSPPKHPNFPLNCVTPILNRHQPLLVYLFPHPGPW